jgi:arsenate reductase
MQATIYHNARCSKSRGALELLKERGIDVEVVEYLKTPPSKELLQELLTLLAIDACALVRKSEPLFKERFEKRAPTVDECFEAMLEAPILIERPIVVIGNRAVVARPPEKALSLL